MKITRKVPLFLLLTTLLFWSCEDQKASGPKVGAVVISPEEQDLFPGETFQLQALVVDETQASLSNIEILWSSSNEDVATVSESGLITAIQPGLVTITAAAGHRTGMCDVMVSDSRRRILSELFTSST